MRRAALYALFFLSGLSALAYELAWQRLLHLVFGVSTLSVSAVLAAFMGGLALGGLLFGGRADRAARPWRLYAMIEFALAATAFLVPPGFALLARLYTAFHSSWHPGPAGSTALRFVLALLVLLPPATLLGATLPVMGRLRGFGQDGPLAPFSLLYAVNTLGAVAGASLTGFLLLRLLGLHHTLHLAAGVNLLVALAAFVLDRKTEAEASAPTSPCHPVTLSPCHSPGLALTCATLTGAVTAGLEVVWSRVLGILTSNSAYGMALLLAVLLSGLSAGSFLQAWRGRKGRRGVPYSAGGPPPANLKDPGDGWRRLARCQAGLVVVTLVSLPFFRSCPGWFVRWCTGASAGSLFTAELTLTAFALFAPAMLLGMSFPLLASLGEGGPGRFGAWLGRLYALNTLGGVAGALLTGFVLLPRLGIDSTMSVLLTACLGVAASAWVRAGAFRPLWPGLTWPATFAALLAGWLALPAGHYLKSAVAEPRRLLYYAEGDNATVAAVEGNGVRTLLVDGQPVAGTSGTSGVDQKMLAHLPLLLHPAPRRALTVGFGSGGTSHSMALHGVAVDCVEIEARVADAAQHFRSENHDVLAHPRFRLILDDARGWLRVADASYDVIVTDCTNIQYRSNGDLYTTDYFRLMRERLEPGGVAAAWVPAGGIREADLKTLLRSFQEVFRHASVWYVNSLPTDFLIVVGTPRRLRIDLPILSRRMGRPGVAADLASVGLADPCRLAYCLLAGEERLAEYLGTGPRNTDDRPVLSYSTYGALFCDTTAENLLGLMACRDDVARFVTNAPPGALMLRHRVASGEVLLGHVRQQHGDGRGALAHYRAAAELLPGDVALGGLVRACQALLAGR